MGWGWLLLLLPLSSCQCLEQTSGQPWTLGVSPDTGEADVSIPPSPDGSSGVVQPVECSEALNDRSDLVVDERGTPWIGYHQYSGPSCERTSLVVARGTPEGDWTREALERHKGIFSVKIIEPSRPVAVYPNPRLGLFRSAMRDGPDDWAFTNLDLGRTRVGPRDGFDLATDGRRFFATFAENQGERVQLFIYDTEADSPRWRSRASLEVPDPRAALSQGLRADDDYLYLTHQNSAIGDSPQFGIARYDRRGNVWDERTYFEGRNAGARPHSLEVTSGGGLCMASGLDEKLLITCGTSDDLDARERTMFRDEPIASRYPASTIEGPGGNLYVAFHPPDNDELRLARRTSPGEWVVRTIFDGSSYGVSTAIDPTDGDLMLAFYTCEGDGESCVLKTLSISV